MTREWLELEAVVRERIILEMELGWPKEDNERVGLLDIEEEE